jgi:hypothetical protein
MTPVLQTQFVSTHGRGNCVQAAVASLLDLPLDSVPAFRDAECMESAISAFLETVEMRRISIRFGGPFEWGDAFFCNQLWHPLGKCHVSGGPVLAYGRSPRGNFGHAVLINLLPNGGWTLAHDPHPDGAGIEGDPTSLHFIVSSAKRIAP